MDKVTWETLVLKCKELELKPESILKMAERMSKGSKGRVETPGEILRGSWVYDVAYHVYHRIGTDHNNKITNKMVIRNYVKTDHYRLCYKTFHQKDWDQLPTIKKSKFTTDIDKQRALVDRHASNCEKLLLSPLGKKQLAFLLISGGSMLEVPGTETEYLKNLKEGMKKLNMSEEIKDDADKMFKREIAKTVKAGKTFDGPPKWDDK